MMKPISAALACAAMIAATSAQAQRGATACLTNAEAEALTLVLMPDLLASIGKTCATVLPASAFVVRPPAPFVAKYRSEASRALPAASGSFKKIAGPDVARLLDTEAGAAMLPVMLPVIAQSVAKDIKTKDCPTVDRFLIALEPLPAANMAKLMVAFFEIGNQDRTKGKSAPFTICPAR